MRFNSLDGWLDWQTSLHPKAIDLGLDRVRKVADQLGLLQPKHVVITVAGTNGKGSSVAMLETMLLEMGHKVGAYTSPHMHRYNERIRVAGVDGPDEWILDAFDSIDQARGEISLSYFEFATLAGLWIFARQRVDIAILEVGLGGRLDAVNIVDADVALITAIGVDHTEWLGEGRDRISLEKAGIARRERPVIVSEPDPPQVMKTFLKQLGSHYFQLGEDFDFSVAEGEWDWWFNLETSVGSRKSTQALGAPGKPIPYMSFPRPTETSKFSELRLKALPEPGLQGRHQFQNVAGAIAVSQLLPERLCPDERAIRAALRRIHLAGRYERIDPQSTQVDFEVILDVAHNPDGARVLARTLEEHDIRGKTYVLLGVMKDKDIKTMLKTLAPVVDVWLLSTPHTERAMVPSALHALLKTTAPAAKGYATLDIAAAWNRAKSMLTEHDRLVVTGSFYTVAEMRCLTATI